MNSFQKYKKVDSTTILDEKNGEVFSRENVNFFLAKFRPKIKEKFMLTYQDSLYQLAINRDLPRTSFSVILYLMSIMDFDNTITINQQDIADDLQTSQQVISRAIQILDQQGYIKILSKRGQANTYLISPALCEKGDHKTRKLVEKVWEEL